MRTKFSSAMAAPPRKRTNSGTARSVVSPFLPKGSIHLIGSVLSVFGSNSSNRSPRKANARAVLANENATL